MNPILIGAALFGYIAIALTICSATADEDKPLYTSHLWVPLWGILIAGILLTILANK